MTWIRKPDFPAFRYHIYYAKWPKTYVESRRFVSEMRLKFVQLALKYRDIKTYNEV